VTNYPGTTKEFKTIIIKKVTGERAGCNLSPGKEDTRK